jgi:hypothetical protein
VDSVFQDGGLSRGRRTLLMLGVLLILRRRTGY